MANSTDLIKVICDRCNGSGKFSFNLLDGDICYGCNGTKYKLKTVAQINASKRQAEKQAKKEAEKQEVIVRNVEEAKTKEEKTLATLRKMYVKFPVIKTEIDNLLAKDIHPDYKNNAILELVIKLARDKGFDPSDNPKFHDEAYNATLYLRLMLIAGK